MTEMQLQQALEQIVTALQGIGGRVFIVPQHPGQAAQLVTCGEQPHLPVGWGNGDNGARGTEAGLWIAEDELRTAPQAKPPSGNLNPIAQTHPIAFEQSPAWQAWLALEATVSQTPHIWAISDLYRATLPSDLALAFLDAEVRGVLIVSLQYRQQQLGYLSVFRNEIDIETLWAGRPDRDDQRNYRPRQSFETWRELKQGQAREWTAADIELIQAASGHFAMAIHQYELYQQVHALNADLARDIEERKQAEIEICALNAELEERVLERTAELQRANTELVREIGERERALRERQKAETSLERLSRQHALILNSAGEGIYGLDTQARFTFVNPAAARMLGYEASELIDQSMPGILKHSQPDGTPYPPEQNPILATLQAGADRHLAEDLFWRRDGSCFPVEYASTPIREDGKIVGAVVVFKDITERQLVERMKDEFVSVVSHELRTPLTSIHSALGLLASGRLSPQPTKSQRMLEIAVTNTERLVRLINDILDIERINSGKVTMEKRLCNAADLMMQAVDVMQAMAEKAEVALGVVPISAQLWVDPDRIVQTLTNLLSNAIKFSPPGAAVWLTAAVESGDGAIAYARPSTPTAKFQVKDRGQGIPDDKLETIFDRFQQVDASNSRQRGGTGLGLAICRSIVQQHGGQIWAESTLGKGSTFYFTLPLAQSEGEGQ